MEARLTPPPALPAFARSPLWPWLATAPFVLWPLYVLSRGEVRWEMLVVMVLVPALAFGGERARRLFVGLFPVGMVAFLYDAMRLVKGVGVTVDRVHLCDLRAMELALFGSSGHTLHDWFQAHPSALLDALCAVPYGTYLYAVLATVGFLYLRDFQRLQRFAWTFFLLNVAGFVTYHLLPAAPPWYFHAHGCTVDLAARASEAAPLARVDARLGVAYFHGFYGRSNDVFGAIPSLHVAYPTLIALETWPYLRPAARALAVTYALLMYLGAVYLDHHWVVDVLVGLSYTAVIWALMRRAFPTAAVTG